ncbi:family 16 glycosylhydrolase [Flavobacterium fluviatile]|uniref:family 16 glycosylhydrolase n=1 Tax=Flavobacterium fluviatile TaxID=1862387 RepID=UPI0013D009B7|nr:family 16 glycosylhydrolase [Flavobacterium fluviatile]
MIKIKTLASVFFLTGTAVVQAQYEPLINAADSGKIWEYQENLSDEFNGNALDWNNKWFYNNNLPTVKAWKWNNGNNVKLVGNAAEIKMSHNNNNIAVDGTYFNSGILKTKGTFVTGYVEARIKGAVMNVPGTDNGRGVCPSFWLYSDFDRSVGEGKTVYSEIDIVELQQYDYFNGEQDDIFDMEHNLHLVRKVNGQDVWFRPKQNVATQKNHYTASFDPTKDYHVYGCEVNEKEIIWYVDGARVASKPNTYWYRPMNVTLSLGLRVPFVKFVNNVFEPVNPLIDARAKNQLSAIPTTMSVDYVRVWKSKRSDSTGSDTGTTNPTDGYKGDIRVFLNQRLKTLNIVLGNFSGESRITMFNLSGTKLLDTTSRLSEIVLPTNSYPNAPYILHVTNQNGVHSQKIFIK